MLQAVLFDFDGTLADSYAAITASVNYVRSLYHLPALEESSVRKLVGFGLQQLMNDIIPNSDPEENARKYRHHHPSVMFTHTRLLPGVQETLNHLHANQIKLGVCSNKPSAITNQLIDALQLRHLFDVVLGPEDSGIPKPDPAMLHLAMQKCGTNKMETLYVGDMTIDIQTARNAGIPVWVVPTGSDDEATLQKANPDRILKRMDELITHFENKIR